MPLLISDCKERSLQLALKLTDSQINCCPEQISVIEFKGSNATVRVYLYNQSPLRHRFLAFLNVDRLFLLGGLCPRINLSSSKCVQIVLTRNYL